MMSAYFSINWMVNCMGKWDIPAKEEKPVVKVEKPVAPRAPKPEKVAVEKLPTELRDDLNQLLALLGVLGNWDRFKKGYRPGNEKLWDVVAKLNELLKKY